MVRQLQEHLEAIYRIECAERAERYVVDPAQAARLGGSGQREQLLVREDDGAVELALSFPPALLEWLARCDHPRAALDGDLDGFCQVAEGVSHFVYLTHSAALDRHVSLLELEAQAEVDKFLICLLHGWGGDVLRWARELLHRLFVAVRYLPNLSPELRWRYGEANRLAKAYCERLLRFVTARDLERLLGEARYAYRLGAEAKLRYLAQAA